MYWDLIVFDNNRGYFLSFKILTLYYYVAIVFIYFIYVDHSNKCINSLELVEYKFFIFYVVVTLSNLPYKKNYTLKS